MTLSQYLSEEELRALLKEEAVEMSPQAEPYADKKSVMIDQQLLFVLKETLKALDGRVAYLENEVSRLRSDLAASAQMPAHTIGPEEKTAPAVDLTAREHVLCETVLAPRAEKHLKKGKSFWKK